MDIEVGRRAVLRRQVRFGKAELIPEPGVPTAWRLVVDGVLQSYVDLADPANLELRYVTWMAKALDLHWPPGHPISGVVLGGGGFTLPRYIAATRPGSQQVVFELDEELVAFITDHLELGSVPGLDVRVRDGEAGIAELAPGSADLVVLDIYAGGAGAPDLATVEFAQQLAGLLRQDGLYVANIWDQPELDFVRRAVASVQNVFSQVLVFAEGSVLMKWRSGNLVVVASNAALPAEELAEWAGSQPHRAFCMNPEQLAAVCGTGRALTREDPWVGPAPAVTRSRKV